MAGVAQPHIYRRLPSFCVAGVGQMALGGALGPGLGAPLLRGRRGTTSHLPSFCVAGVGQMALGGALGPGLGAAVTPVTPRHFCVAGVALGDIHLDFTWQAWHNLTSTVVYRRFAWDRWPWVAPLGRV